MQSPFNEKSLHWYLGLSTIFVGALITANIVSSKIIMLDLFFGPLFVPAGVLAYSITFAITDTICEVWGKSRTQTLVNTGFLVQLMVLALIAIAIAMPAAPFWPNQPAYAGVLGATGRIIVASLVAYFISQTLDVYIFSWLKKKSPQHKLWLRNNISTFLSQTVDTVVFITIAFAGKMDLLPLMGGQLLIKWFIAMVDTPIVYGLVYVVRLRIGTTAANTAANTAA